MDILLQCMTALLSEMSFFCVRGGCEIQLASYGSKHAWQSPSDKQFVHTYTHNLKTTGHIWEFCILNNRSTIEDIPCVRQSCMRDLTGELGHQTCISRSLIQHCVRILQAVHPLLFVVQLRMTTIPTYLMTAYYTPNDGFTANYVSFYKSIVDQLHYTLQGLFN